MGMEPPNMKNTKNNLIIGLEVIFCYFTWRRWRPWVLSLSGHFLSVFPFILVWRSWFLGSNAAIHNVTGNECGGLVFDYNTCTAYTDYTSYKEKNKIKKT